MNFHGNTNSDKRSTRVTHHAKAPSAGSTEATGSSRGLFRRALATRAASSCAKGSGAPSSRRSSLALIAGLALMGTILALSAAPASAAPPTVTTPVVSVVSYTSAQVSAKYSTPSSQCFGTSIVKFQYSSDEGATWKDGSEEFIPGAAAGREVSATLKGLSGSTKYFVRLFVNNCAEEDPEGFSPEPNPSFTTLPVDPPSVLSTDNASEVKYTTATVKGKITRPANADHAFDVNCHFQYVTDQQFQATGFTENPGDAPCEGANPIEAPGTSDVQAHLAGLAPDTEYHLRIFVSNASPTTDAKEAAQTFETLTVDPPSVLSTDNASEVEYTQATVKGVVERPATSADPAFDVTCNFQYVTDQQFNDNPTGEEFAGATPVACEPETITATGPTPVKAKLTGLVASTEYHLRLSASNLGGSDAKEAAAAFTTAGPVPKPIVTATDNASEVKFNSATLTGKVQRPAGADPALDVNCHFEYITDAQLLANEGNGDPGFTGAQTADCEQNPITAAKVDEDGEIGVSAKAGLIPTTKYHLRLVAENAGGSDAKDAANTFTTPEAELPVVTIDPVAGGTFTTAHVSGTVDVDDPGKDGANVAIEISADGGASWSGFFAGPTFRVQGPGPHVVAGNFTGLQPSTTYTLRILATYSTDDPVKTEANGEMAFSQLPNPSITTEPPPAPPTAEDLAATDITATSAHFSAKVDPHAPAGPLSELAKKAYETKWHFECTPECKDVNGNPIAGGTVQGEEGLQTVAGDAKRLEPNTPYEVRLVISSEGGGETVVETFPTKKIPPMVKSAPGASDGKGGYTLQGTVNPNNETITDCKFEWGPNSSHLDFSADCSPMPSGGSKPVTVEAHLSGLNTGVTYHALLVVTYGAGAKADGGPQEFEATLDPAQSCPNEQQRIENSSLALPECRAYEKVSPAGKEGFGAVLLAYDGGVRVQYGTEAGNIAKSGQGILGINRYVATRSAAGWETIPNLNGSSGSVYDAPSNFDPFGSGVVTPNEYSSDLLSSVWNATKLGSPVRNFYLRRPDGTFALLGTGGSAAAASFEIGGTSDDLSHLLVTSAWHSPPLWGPGVYEFLGTGNEQPPRRVDVDNSGSPISTCSFGLPGSATSNFISGDGRVVLVRVAGGCGGVNPLPTTGLWARIDGTTTINVSASLCKRTAADPGGACNAPVGDGGCATNSGVDGIGLEGGPGCRFLEFQAATPDGSRIFFTTKQQLLDADTDESGDIYACDIPAGTPAPVGDANPCSALRQVSAGDPTGAAVESFRTSSENGATVLFTAKGVLAANEDALKEKAVAGDHNLYAWRTDASHPAGETAFVGRLDSDEPPSTKGAFSQSTPDGRYLVFTTASQLLETDTDNARDVYRYDVEAGKLTRASTNVFGVAGNGPFDAQISFPAEHNPTTAISDDGQKIVFTTTEPLNLAVDNNDEPDVYLWTPDRVSLISTGSSGAAPKGNVTFKAFIDSSGEDIYFESAQPLTPADGDDSNDVYDARIGGGFSFAQAAPCSGEACRPVAKPAPPKEALSSAQPGPGNPPRPKTCPKGKVRKKNGKCVKKSKKHSGKKHSGKKASHKQGGGK